MQTLCKQSNKKILQGTCKDVIQCERYGFIVRATTCGKSVTAKIVVLLDEQRVSLELDDSLLFIIIIIIIIIIAILITEIYNTIHYITYPTRTTYNPVLYYVFFPFYTHWTNTHRTREKWKGKKGKKPKRKERNYQLPLESWSLPRLNFFFNCWQSQKPPSH